jgi:hypothetical protein
MNAGSSLHDARNTSKKIIDRFDARWAPPNRGGVMNKWHRIRWAGLHAVTDRFRQELQRWLDRAMIRISLDRRKPVWPFEHLSPSSAGKTLQPRLLSRQMAGRRQHRKTLPRFFSGANNIFIGRYVAMRFPDIRDQIVELADDACKNRLRLMSYRLDFDVTGFDWHRDAVSGRSAPRKHWSRIDPLSQQRIGDSKITWELNRHQWFLDLALAWRFTGNERYVEVIIASIRDWIKENPPGTGINWASSLEVSFRLITWCWVLDLLAGSRGLDARLQEQILDWIRIHAIHIEKYMSHYFSPNTHLTGEALGLVYASVVLEGFPRARRWRQLGTRVLLDQLPRHILPDGVYFEQSTCYARYTAEIYLHFLILAERNGLPVPSQAKEQICRLFDYLVSIRRPDGALPQIGDADGGRLLSLAARGPDDCRGVIAVAAALFHRSDYAWAAGDLAPEVAWLLGHEGCETFESLEPEPPQGDPSRTYAQGGYVLMRNSWESSAHQLVLDVGPIGDSISCGHGHADLLSIQCSVFGEPYLVDPGTYCYTAAATWRDHFRSTYAHSTIVVDGENQANSAGPFSWRQQPHARLRRWISAPQFDYADAEHHAYARLQSPVVHRRRVLFAKPRYWVLVDDLYGEGTHQSEVLFQFGNSRLLIDSNGWAVCSQSGERGLFLRSFSTVPLSSRIKRGNTAPIAGWVSPNYGQRVPAPLLVYTAESKLPLRIVTLLLPKAQVHCPVPDATFEGDSIALRFGGNRETIHFDDEQIILERDDGQTISPLSQLNGHF